MTADEYNLNEQIGKALYHSIVEDNLAIYRETFNEKGDISEWIEYWQKAVALYRTLDESQREVFFSILRQAITDTVSNVLAVLDNVASLTGDWRFSVTANGVDTEEGLQDAFLAYVEELED